MSNGRSVVSRLQIVVECRHPRHMGGTHQSFVVVTGLSDLELVSGGSIGLLSLPNKLYTTTFFFF